jgi:hypothetical protein
LSLTIEEEHRLRVFENRVLRIISGSKRQELIGGWKKFIMRSFITIFSFKEDEMSRSSSTYKRDKKFIQ